MEETHEELSFEDLLSMRQKRNAGSSSSSNASTVNGNGSTDLQPDTENITTTSTITTTEASTTEALTTTETSTTASTTSTTIPTLTSSITNGIKNISDVTSLPSRYKRRYVDYDNLDTSGRRGFDSKKRSRNNQNNNGRRNYTRSNNNYQEHWRKNQESSSSSSSNSLYRVKGWKKGSFDWSKISETLDIPQFCKALTNLLAEPNEGLIYHIVAKTGKAFAMGILKETEKVQDEGGLYIGQYKRKRTTGGVFIKLLRDNISKEKWDEINKSNREDPLNNQTNNHNHNHRHSRKHDKDDDENDNDEDEEGAIKIEKRKRYRPKERILEQRKPKK